MSDKVIAAIRAREQAKRDAVKPAPKQKAKFDKLRGAVEQNRVAASTAVLVG